MYEAQVRYWDDNPRVDQVLRSVHAKKGARQKYTPPTVGGRRADGPRPFDWSLLDKP